jgi:hypothetical protein
VPYGEAWQELLFDAGPFMAAQTVVLNGEEVLYKETLRYADPDEASPEVSVQEVLMRWPDGSAFNMQFHLSPAWWRDEHEGRAVEFYGAVHDLIREGLDEASREALELDAEEVGETFYVSMSTEGVVVETETEEPHALLGEALRTLADWIEDGTIEPRPSGE